jgi:hypothetical protein
MIESSSGAGGSRCSAVAVSALGVDLGFLDECADAVAEPDSGAGVESGALCPPQATSERRRISGAFRGMRADGFG